MPKVVVVNEKKEIEIPPGSNLRVEAAKQGIEIYGGIDRYLNCRGNGLCGTCRVLVKKGNLRRERSESFRWVLPDQGQKTAGGRVQASTRALVSLTLR